MGNSKCEKYWATPIQTKESDIMYSHLSKNELEKRLVHLENEMAQQEHFKRINQVMLKISNVLSCTENLDELYRYIHMELNSIIDTTNFFISLYNKDEDSLFFPYFIDSVDACYPEVLEISKVESLTARVIQTGTPLLITKEEMLEQRRKTIKTIPTCTPSEIWLGVPLRNWNDVIGVMAVQSYSDPCCYNHKDLGIMLAVADQVGMAIELKRSEIEKERLISKLKSALQKIKVLSGLLPICSHCKKIRDDKGYWNEVENYIAEHSDIQFTHSICNDCAKKHYPEFYDQLKDSLS